MSESYNILYLLRNGHMGGSQRQMIYLAQGLDAAGYRLCSVFCNDGACAEQMRAYGLVHIINLPPWRSIRGVLRRKWLLKKFLTAIQGYKPSLVHCADVWLAPYAVAAAKMLDVPSIVHLRAPLAVRDIQKFGCSHASKIISISPRTTQRLLDAGVARHAIMQIYDSVDTDLFCSNGLRADMPNAALRVAIVGRVEPGKRQDVFMRLARAVVALRKDIVFLVVGEVRDTNYYSQLLAYVRDNGLQDRVHFFGERADIANVLRGTDVLVSFSGGSVIYEAMACGCVVMSAGFSVPAYSLIQHGITGYLFETINIDELAAHISAICDDRKLRQEVTDRACQWIQHNLSKQTMQRNTYDVYAGCLNDYQNNHGRYDEKL